MANVIDQLDLFQVESDPLHKAIISLKFSQDSLRKKLFSEIDEIKREIEFLSIQLELLHEVSNREGDRANAH